MITQVPRQTLNTLFSKADDFRKHAPWEWMHDDQVFGIVHPETGQKAYCCIMGHLGEFFGLAVYVGAEGLRCLQDMNDEQSDQPDEEVLYRQNCLICSFEDEGEIDPEDLELIKSLSLNFRGAKAFPSFRSYRPGFMPWAINEAESQWLVLALEQGIVLSSHFRENPDSVGSLGIQSGKQTSFRVKNAEGWGYAMLDTDSAINLSPPQLTIPLSEMSALKKLPKSDSIWLFEHFYLDLPSMDPAEDRPFFPKAIVLLDVEQETYASIEAMKPDQVDEQAAEVIVEAFRTNQFIPAQMVVANRENYILLKNFCKALGIDLYLDQEMNLITEMRETVMEIMNGGDDEDDEENN